MIKLLKTLLEINNYENIDKLITIWEYIGENKKNLIITNCIEWRILEQYYNLLNKNISQEEFMMIGDYTSEINIYKNKNNIERLFEIKWLIEDPLLYEHISEKTIITNNQTLIFFESKGSNYNQLKEDINKMKSKIFII